MPRDEPYFVAGQVGLFCVAVLLAACTTGPQLPPASPTIPQIATTWAELQMSGAPPAVILNVGATLDDQGCYGWFDQQVLGGQKSSLASAVIGLGAAGAGIAGAPVAVPAGLGLLSALTGAVQANSPTGADPVATYALVVRVRQAWLAAVPVPQTTDEAWVQLDAYHQLCTLSGIRSVMAQAMMTVPVAATLPAVPVISATEPAQLAPLPLAPRVQIRRQNNKLELPIPSQAPCYMNVMGCRVPRVTIGAQSDSSRR